MLMILIAELTASDVGVAGEQTGALKAISVAPDTTHVALTAAMVPVLVHVKVIAATAAPSLTVWPAAALVERTVLVAGGGTLATVNVKLRLCGVGALLAVVASS